ncbi:MAG: dephospho-CoA kinase [Syntrophaceae bacterium]|nr:MAG: dephospho-CoA kinase [Syntrophaceae bacterium]
MLNVGLTGGIACGKSTVAQMFVQRGAYAIDFDMLAHNVQQPGRAAWEKVVGYFGEGILLPDKKIDRTKLAAIVFSEPEKLTALNQIVHPYVFLEWNDYLEKIVRRKKNAIIIASVPLLFETGRQALFDVTVVVSTSREIQLNRLMARNNLGRQEAQKRIDSQMPIEQKAALADMVIDNSGSVEETEKRVEDIWRRLLCREKNKN